jgi:rubrerythrin
MSPIDEKMLEPLRQGMVNEIRGRAFYLEAAKRSKHAAGAKMFESLARDEEMHLKVLQQQYQAITQKGKWLTMDDARTAAAPAPELNLFPQGVEKQLPADADDLKALELAMGFEKRGYDLYKSASEVSTDLTAKAMYEFLVQEEGRHYELIQNSLEYLRDKGMWYFQDLEKPMFEG